ncbi:T9SS sorting signal type C domain-containing protein [Flavobacterium sp. ANB]|uniref:T9SS sorting signal type C domain-containing protein n=1 Tax=unclassified Flavobacterium TaxID=196869 RepID=UPI0012B7356B|nr:MULTISPECIES: T9SS sorting signal type C domain-containing protein [unclassified Flavobacterium]MBF4517183.1 T9SS sorting signal type C domain-containing protein [Flavobacterium sp. ANB]MTD72524.1 T9SS sorting signal type C domain-containing protein [Flavobacterium sp. LC2016-13]
MKLKLSLLVSFIYVSLWAQPPHTFTANGSLIVPAGITSMNIQAWGGGGAGGGAGGAGVLLGRGAAGGGGGAYASTTITVIASNTLNIQVGGQALGALGDGANGGNSTIVGYETIIFAAGGSGGGSNNTGVVPTGGAGGTLAASFAVGGTKTAGANGGNGESAALSVGLTSGAGGNGANPIGGTGLGGAARSSAILGTAAGNPGAPPGGGGGGAINSALGAAQLGGSGALGKVIVTYSCPTYSITGISAQNGCITFGTSIVTLTSSAASLPTGTYTVTYNRTNPSATGQTATMTVSTAGTGTFTAPNLALGINTITVTSLTSGACVSPITANNVVNNVTISPESVGGSVAGGTTICSGFTSAQLTLSSHTGTVVKWQSSVSPFSVWTDIPTATGTTYTSGALTQTTQFRAVVQSGTCTSLESTPTTVNVNPLPSITLGAVAPVCTNVGAQNTTLAYTGATNTPTTYSIVWNASPANSFVTVTDATLNASPISIAVPAGTAAGTYTGTITVKNANNCTSSPGLPFSVVVNPLPSITLGAVAPVCTSAGAQNTTLAYSAPTNTPTTYSIVWNASPTNTFVAVTDATLNASPISIAVPAGTAAGTYIGTVTVKNGNSCTSSSGLPFSVVVNPLPSITLGAVAPVCTNAGAQNTTLAYSAPTNTPTTYSIVWSTSPTNTFVTVTDATLNASPISIAIPAGTAAGTYTGTVTVKNGNSCTSSPGLSFSVVVNPLPTITLGTVAPVCASASTQNITLPYTSVANTPTTYSIVWSASPTNTFIPVTDVTLGASPITIAVPAGTAGGTYTGTVTVKNANSCTSSPGVTFNVVVNPLPSAPVIGTITPPTCLVATGSIALSGLPVGGTLTLYPGAIVEPYSGTTTTISGLTPNTYTFIVSNGTCTSLISANAIVPALVTNTFTTSWSNGTPTLDQNLVFAGNYVSAGGGAGNINGCTCTVNPGVNVVIQFLDTLTLTNSLSNNGGTVTFENHSSLLQITNAVNSGNIIYKRIAPQIRQADYVYWSTPVNPQRLLDVSPLTSYDRFMAFSGDSWVSIFPKDNMIVGKGYIIRGPNGYSNTAKADYAASFIGIPNNGNLSGETVAAGKYYLIGNPYPSALNANAFLAANPFLDGTLYFWTHNTPVVLSGPYRYNSDDYASYNRTGGVGVPAASGNAGNNNTAPSGNIASGQSFFASSINPGTIVFNNSMRFGGATNIEFFKSANTSETEIERHRVWLNMTNDGGAFKQMLVGYVEGASNEYENKYDGKSFDANPYLDFYSVGNGNNYVIQGRALPFIDTDTVTLGYRSTISGDFTIAIDHADGDLSNHAIYLEDKITNTIHDLRAGNYTFNTSTGTYTNRFVLTYSNKSLGTGEFEKTDKNVLVTVKNKAITVSSDVDRISTVYIYDFSGKLLYKKANISDTILKIDNLKISDQVLLVKVILETNATKTYKIIY